MNMLKNDQAIRRYMSEQMLPDSYLATYQEWFLPLVEKLAEQLSLRTKLQQPLLVGINGSQGSGKSTLAGVLKTALEADSQYKVVILSIDDFYLTVEERQALAENIHPLLRTRGVPGTHDITLLKQVLDSLNNSHQHTAAIPRFDKATDDRKPASEWDGVQTPVDMIILEGWCVGSSAEIETALVEPVNNLERIEDPDAHWRTYVNQQLAGTYQTLFAQINYWIMLQAPSFDCVFQWRLEQEEKLRAQKNDAQNAQGIMSAEQIARFIQHYQRITEHTLVTLPDKVNCLFKLDKNRKISTSSYKNGD